MFERPSNPGAFDSRSYYLNQKICGRILPESIEVNDTTIQYGKEWLARLREQWKDELLTRMGDEGAVLSGILLGDKSGLEPETKELYQKNGIAHLLAVSGLHVSFIGLMLYRLMRKAGAPFLTGALVGTLILFPYAVMTGFSVSAKRAVLMYLIRMGAEVSGRVYDLLTSLAVSAAILLGAHPRSVYDVGFLLSFGAIFAIWAGETLWIHLTGKEKKGFHGKFLAAIWPGICIQLLTFPVLLTSYFEFPLYSVLINLWVIPLMSVVMGAGLLGSLCCLILPPFATVFLWISKLVLCFYEWNCQIMLQLPAARVITGEPGWVRICCYLCRVLEEKEKAWDRISSGWTLLSSGTVQSASRRTRDHHGGCRAGRWNLLPDAWRMDLPCRRRKYFRAGSCPLYSGTVSKKPGRGDTGLCVHLPRGRRSHQRCARDDREGETGSSNQDPLSARETAVG